MKRVTFQGVGSMLVAASFVLVSSAAFAQTQPKAAPAKPVTTTTVDQVKKPAATAKRKPISAADKKAIIALFKGVDPNLYRLEFNHGRETYGKKKIEMQDLEQVKRVTNPGEESGYVVLIVSDDGTMYILAATHGDQSQLVQVLGQEKTAQLNKIMSKYAR